MYSYRTIQRKANEAGLSLQRGYQHYLRKGWGYVTDANGEKIIGYQVLDCRYNFLIHPSCTDLYDHALSYEEAIDLVKEICCERGVTI